MSSNLKALSSLISESVATIVEVCEQSGKEFPSLDRPIEPSEFSPTGIRNDPTVIKAIGIAVAAATQLSTMLTPPPVTLATSSAKWALTACLSVAEGTHVAEIVREAGPKGMHVNEISAVNGTDPKKLARILRYLATHHWFKEVHPNVFTQNLLSSLLDTGKNFQEIKNDVASKYDNTSGLAAFVAFNGDECAKAGAWLLETLTDPATSKSEEPYHASMQRGLDIKEPLWEYWDRPKNNRQLRRFGAAMSSTDKFQPPRAILNGFDWSSVPSGGILVDVGGGLGHISMEVAKIRPDIHVVLEDRPPVVDRAKIFWKENLPGNIASGHIHFFGIDFFEKQPVLPGAPDVFLLRLISHDWSDKYLIKLLKNLRAVATPSTKLLVMDSIVEYACSVPKESQLSVKGIEWQTPPDPLLPNMGLANLAPYSIDLMIMNCINSEERTIEAFINVFTESGWKLSEVKRDAQNKSFWPCIIATPIQPNTESFGRRISQLSKRAS